MIAAERLARLSPGARAETLNALDDLSRPLEIGDLDLAFAKAGISRSKRRPMIRALLAHFTLIAVVPKE